MARKKPIPEVRAEQIARGLGVAPQRPPCVAGCPGQVSHSIAQPNPELKVYTLTCGLCGAASSYEEPLETAAK